jgi:cell wall-associated NlpC family hydrolase
VSQRRQPPHLRMIWTGAGRALPSDDLLNSGSTSNSDDSLSPRDWSDRGTTGRTGPVSYSTSIASTPIAPLGRQSSRQSGRGRRSALGIALSLALVGTAVLSTSTASAAPSAKVKEVAKRVKTLNDQQEQAAEKYNDTVELLKSVTTRIAAADKKLAALQVDLAQARIQVGQLASETYRRGALSTLTLVLGDDPDMALAQAGLLPTLSERQADAMSRLKDSEAKLKATEADILDQQKKAKAARADLLKAKKTADKKLAEAKAQLSQLKAADVAAIQTQYEPSDGGGSASCAGNSVNSASAAGAKAITFACAQIGDPYVWAAAGPNAWDCSGLTMMAFRQAGISLPHSSRDQVNYGTRISVSSIKAGDVIFFNSPISHVGIYLGNNEMVHAPNSNTHVKVERLYATPSAAVRL